MPDTRGHCESKDSRVHSEPIRIRRQWLAAVMLLATGSAAQTQDFPNRPIRLIAPFAAGASTDFLARPIAQTMSRNLGQPVVVDNKPGAGGILAAEQTARAAPDGYTFMLTSAGIVTM